MSEKDQFEQVRALIKARKFDEARALLHGIDHPKAQEWLDKIDQISPSQSLSNPMGKSHDYVSSPSPAYTSGGSAAISSGNSGGINIIGVILLLIVVILGGGAVGAALHFSGRFMYLICVSSVIASAIAGFIFQAGVKFAKVRNGTIVLLLGLVMGVVTYGSFRYGDYLFFLEEVRQESPGISSQEINQLLEMLTGQTGFLGYVNLEAEEGLSISRASDFDSEGGFDLPEPLTWVYWGIELLIMVAGPVMLGGDQSSEPFCENRNDWLRFNHVGNVPSVNAEQCLQAMQVGDFSAASTFMVPISEKVQHPYLKVEVGDCGADQPTGMIRVHAMNVDNRGRADNKKLIEATLPHQAIKSLNR